MRLLKEEMIKESKEKSKIKKEFESLTKKYMECESGAKMEHLCTIINKFFDGLI